MLLWPHAVQRGSGGDHSHMDWLEQNLDAYRIIAEILNDLRETLRRRLEQLHGDEWYRSGLPDGMLAQLIERKEQEKAIDWYESEYQQIMNYALFPDLLAILEHNSQALPQILKLAPTTSLLQARFLELEVMRAKLGRARPISETELSFLGTFHLRFRKAIEENRQASAVEPPTRPAPPPAPQVQPPAAPQPPHPTAPPPPPQQPVTPPPAEPTPPPPTQPESTPVAPPPAQTPKATADTARPASVPPPPDAQPTAPPAVEVSVEDDEPPLEEALEDGHHQAVLRQLYREVTTIAEGIWVKDIPPPARVWEKVSVSSWYETNFSKLGLRPLSDFYDIIAKVDQRMREGTSREGLQKYLKEVNFAQILLSLRDMFQRNHI